MIDENMEEYINYINELREKWDETVERLSDELSYQEYVDAILLMRQSTIYIITGFESYGDIKVFQCFNLYDMEETKYIILPNRLLTGEEERYIEENYRDCILYDYKKDNKNFAIFSLFHDHNDKRRIIPRLRPVWDRINNQFGPIHELLCNEVEKLKESVGCEEDDAGD